MLPMIGLFMRLIKNIQPSGEPLYTLFFNLELLRAKAGDLGMRRGCSDRKKYGVFEDKSYRKR